MTVMLVALLSGAMFYLSQGLSNVWALAWIAPAPLLWLAYGDTARWKVLAASMAAFAAGQIYLLQCYWGQIPPSVIVPVILALCVLFTLSVWFAGEGLHRGSALAALIGSDPPSTDSRRSRMRTGGSWPSRRPCSGVW